MLKQTLIFALRSFRKSVLLNSLNLTGLTLGLSVFFLVSLFVYQEGSYEQDFTNRDRIYQVGTHFLGSGPMARASDNLARALAAVPEVESVTAFTSYDKKIFFEDGDYQSRRVIDVDASFLDVFDFELLAGDVKSIFDQPRQLIINEDVAREIFGTIDVLGKELKVGTYLFNYEVCVISGVSKSPEFKTQLDFDIIRSGVFEKEINSESWTVVGPYVYATLYDGVDKEQFQEKLDKISEDYIYPVRGAESGGTFEEWQASNEYLGYFAESLDELRYSSTAAVNMMPPADRNRTNTMIIVGLAALIISIINFINIATAKASLRMKEVAIKRLMGASRKGLIWQFMLESFIVILLSSVLALGLVEAFVHWRPEAFSGFVEYSVLHSAEWVTGVLSFIFLLTFISGTYPAVYLSSGNIVTILKNGLTRGSFSILNAATLRKGSTVLQFTCSIGLICAIITMFLQIDYMKHKDLGFETSDVMVLKNVHDLGDKVDAFRSALTALPAVVSSSYANELPLAGNNFNNPSEVEDKEGKTHLVTYMGVEGSFAETMGLRIKTGKGFTYADQPLLQKTTGVSGGWNGREVLINEQTARALGLENPIGEKIDGQIVVGVVEDFLFNDLNTAIGPVILYRMVPQEISSFFYNPLFIRLNSLNAQNRELINQAWKSLTDRRIDLEPMDANYDRLLAIENTSFNAILVFSVFAVLVSCIGLFGLAVFTVDQRVKEFGIRKVLGASVRDIARLFSWDFLKLVLLAFIIAMPLVYYVLDRWLEGFTHHVELGYFNIILTGVLAGTIATATIIFQSVKAGTLNPADTLRRE